MQNMILDIRSFEDKQALHQYFQEQLGFDDYYGANLDALYDELTSTTDPLSLTLRYPGKPTGEMKRYIPRLLAVFQDAMRENYNLSVQFQEAE